MQLFTIQNEKKKLCQKQHQHSRNTQETLAIEQIVNKKEQNDSSMWPNLIS